MITSGSSKCQILVVQQGLAAQVIYLTDTPLAKFFSDDFDGLMKSRILRWGMPTDSDFHANSGEELIRGPVTKSATNDMGAARWLSKAGVRHIFSVEHNQNKGRLFTADIISNMYLMKDYYGQFGKPSPIVVDLFDSVLFK